MHVPSTPPSAPSASVNTPISQAGSGSGTLLRVGASRLAPAVAQRHSFTSLPPAAPGFWCPSSFLPLQIAPSPGASGRRQAPYLATQLLELVAGRQPPACQRLRPLGRLPCLLLTAAPPRGGLLRGAGECKAIRVDILLRPGGHHRQSRAPGMQHSTARCFRSTVPAASAVRAHTVNNSQCCWLLHSKGPLLASSWDMPTSANLKPA